MRLFRRSIIAAFLGGALSITIASCGGGGGSVPATTQAVRPPARPASTTVQTTASTGNCTTQPVKSIQASVSSITVSVGQSPAGTFIVCTQYFSKYTAVVGDSTIASVSIAPATPVNDQLYEATVTVTGLKAGSTTVAITGKKGNTVTVSITVLGTLSMTCTPAANEISTNASCSYTYPGYNGSYTTSASSTSGNCTAGAASNGSFTVTDSTAESCTPKLTPTSGPAAPVTQTVSFVGPLSVTCDKAAITGNNANCSYSDPGYTGDFTPSESTTTCHIPAASITPTAFSLTDSAAEGCTVTLTEASAPAQHNSAGVQFVGPLSFICPGAGSTGTSISCTVTNPNYSGISGTYTQSASSTSTNCSVTAVSNGSLSVSDSTAESCAVTLTPSSPESAVTQTIAFSTPAGGVGPLSLACPSNALIGNTVSCTYSNPGYAGAYTTSGSGSCSVGSAATSASGSISAADNVVETCTVTLTPTSGTETAVQQSIVFESTGGGGGGGGCSGVRHGTKVKNGHFVVTC